jgi:hypothetical protein
MTLAAPALPGVATRSSRNRATSAEPVAVANVLATPAAKRARVQTTTPSTAAPAQPNMALEQWLDDIANVDISLSISVGANQNPFRCDDLESTKETEESGDAEYPEASTCGFSVSIPEMLTRVLQSKFAIDPSRLHTQVSPSTTEENSEVFVALTVRGREKPIAEAIAGGLTPRKAFLRTAPHISRVASRLQDCMRQMLGMKDFVVKVD